MKIKIVTSHMCVELEDASAVDANFIIDKVRGTPSSEPIQLKIGDVITAIKDGNGILKDSPYEVWDVRGEFIYLKGTEPEMRAIYHKNEIGIYFTK